MHQGEIGVICPPGKGSEFFFVLPFNPVPTDGKDVKLGGLPNT